MRAFVIGLLLLLAGGSASAGDGDIAAVRQQIEASLRVRGQVELDTTGALVGHAIDHVDRLDPGVVAILEQTLPRWRFAPVVEQGVARPATADMSLLLVADKTADGGIRIRIRSAHFSLSDIPSDAKIHVRKRGTLAYPGGALAANVSGTVYVALRIDQQGKVVDAVARQVDLRYLDREQNMERWRELLARTTVAQLKDWRFRTPRTGAEADQAYFTAILPVDYSLDGTSIAQYGKWQSYIPGPRMDVPWLDARDQDRASGAEALANGQLGDLGSSLEVLTPLEGG